MNSNREVEKSLRYSFFDGVFASGMVGFTQEYFTPFLLLLGGKAKEVGILTALPNLFASLLQFTSADLTAKLQSRKKIINIFVFLQALMLLPLIIIASNGAASPPVFVSIVILFTSFGSFATPAWASLMSDLVPQHIRGEYFGWRNKLLGFVAVASTFMAGFILHKMKNVNIFYGFVVIFSTAFIFRVISWYFLTRMHEPHLEHREEDRFTLFNFLVRMKESNFAKFVLFVSMMSFSVNLASPFFAVLMLKDLSFSYLMYTLLTVTATLTVYLTIRRWGKHADRIGNIKIIKFTSLVIGIVPLLWIVNRNPIFLFIFQIISGFAWAGFNLCVLNFIYDAVSPQKRVRCISYFNVLNGLALCFGALIGGFLLSKLPPLFGHRILTLLFVSSLFRLTVGLFMPRRISEVRSVRHVSSNQLFLA
jgi:MFS family permease